MEYKIVTASSASGLNNTVNGLRKEGWEAKGSHQVVRTHEQKRFAGMQHKDTTYQHEYSQTMTKEFEQQDLGPE
jgi:hypothetical protein